MSIIDIATRRTPTSDYADLYVEIRPGTDLALANGNSAPDCRQGMGGRVFRSRRTSSSSAAKKISLRSVGAASAHTRSATHSLIKGRESSLAELEGRFSPTTRPKRSRDHAVRYSHRADQDFGGSIYGASTRGTVSLWCMGVNQHTRGTWMNNLINDMHLADRQDQPPRRQPAFSLTGQPSACGTVREVGTLCNRLPSDRYGVNKKNIAKPPRKIWGLEPGTIPAKPGYHTVDMFRALARGDVKAIWIQTTNPWVIVAQSQSVSIALKATVDSSSSVTSIPTPTTKVGRPGSAFGRLGRTRGSLRQHGAAHAALGKTGRTTGRSTRRCLADHRGRQAHGNGRSLPLVGERMARGSLRRVPALFPRHWQGPRLVCPVEEHSRTSLARSRRQGNGLPLRRRSRPPTSRKPREFTFIRPRSTAKKPLSGCVHTSHRRSRPTTSTRCG